MGQIGNPRFSPPQVIASLTVLEKRLLLVLVESQTHTP